MGGDHSRHHVYLKGSATRGRPSLLSTAMASARVYWAPAGQGRGVEQRQARFLKNLADENELRWQSEWI